MVVVGGDGDGGSGSEGVEKNYDFNRETFTVVEVGQLDSTSFLYMQFELEFGRMGWLDGLDR